MRDSDARKAEGDPVSIDHTAASGIELRRLSVRPELRSAAVNHHAGVSTCQLTAPVGPYDVSLPSLTRNTLSNVTTPS